MSETVTLTIDGQEVTVPAGTLIIRAAEQMGTYIPRFCDHPLLDPLGACRQCLVEVEGQRKPLTACTTPVADGMVVKTQHTSDLARDGQEGVLELLLINHPLDCPMCDKGGECPLQDQALAYGPGDSRYVDAKRRFIKPIPISPAIKLDRERCVLCARCTRFADQISGDPFIELFERGALEQVSISPDEPYESIFSGNVVQICPVGALTATPYRFLARPFDTVTTPSTCNRCASGCSIDVQTRRGQLVRVLARADAEVNDEWLCDKGRWGYEYAGAPTRVTEPMVRKEGEFVAVTWAEALSLVAERLAQVRDAGDPIAVMGGAQLADEDAYALSRFARTVLRTNDVIAGPSAPGADATDLYAALPGARTATNADIDAASVIVVAGCDIQQESPIVYLRLRKAARRGATIVEVGPRRTALASAGARWLACPPGGETGVLVALSRALLERGPEAGLDPWTRAAVEKAAPVAAAAGVDRKAAEEVAGLLADARDATVILGGDDLLRRGGAVPLAWNLALALGGTFGWVPRKAGARGAVWAGLHTGLLPGGRRVTEAGDRAAVEQLWGAPVPEGTGRQAADVLSAGAGAVVLVGADPVTDGSDPRAAEQALDRAGFVVALDMFRTPSTEHADVILPAAAIYERGGSLTNWEGRRRALEAAVPPPGLAQADHEILATLADAMGVPFPRGAEALRREMELLDVAPSTPRALPIPQLIPREQADGFLLVPAPMLINDGTMMSGADELRATGDGPWVGLSVADAERLAIGDGDPVRVTTTAGEVVAPARVRDDIISGSIVVPAHDARSLDGSGGGPGILVGVSPA